MPDPTPAEASEISQDSSLPSNPGLDGERDTAIRTVLAEFERLQVALGEAEGELQLAAQSIGAPDWPTARKLVAAFVATAGRREGITLWPDTLDGGWVAECHLLPGCISQGDTLQEALANVLDAAVAITRVATDSGERISLEGVIAQLGLTQAEIDAAGQEPTQ